MNKDYDFTMWLRVYEPEQLLAAALAHPETAEAQMTEDDFRAEDGSVDVNACLTMILDPGKIPGCEIYSSGATGR